MQTLRGKAAIVTGASRGIGAATARLFAELGAKVVLVGRSADAIQVLADEIGGVAAPGDVTIYEDVERAVGMCVERFGRLDVMVNNAGAIAPIARLADSDPAAWAEAADVNFKGVYHGLRAALPVMLAQGGGTVVNVSSGAAVRPLEGWSHYCAGKAAALMLTQAAHLEYQDQGIRVVGLSPGTVATEMQVLIKASGINPASQLDPSVHIPPEWPARAIAWLCTPEAAEFAGTDVSLRDETIRRRIGLVG
ncbi:MAG: SDR family oxidoreductase [Geminicoccaceae bacterium]|nr:MAG: SDR family oxidoreductase [Geminicoccaceae bacterium]